MYFITCFSNFETDYLDNFRTFGFFSDYEDCRRALNGNWCDMHEFYYDFAVVECMEEGIHSHAKQMAWFRWSEEKKGFYETENPDWANGYCNFALG